MAGGGPYWLEQCRLANLQISIFAIRFWLLAFRYFTSSPGHFITLSLFYPLIRQSYYHAVNFAGKFEWIALIRRIYLCAQINTNIKGFC